MNDKEYNNILDRLNDIKYNELKHKLDDLSNSIVSYKDNEGVPSFVLDVPSADLTELEKSLVCIALYWLYKDVREKVCAGGSGPNWGADAVVHTLSVPNVKNEKIDGGYIGMFFKVCGLNGVFNIGIIDTSGKKCSGTDFRISWCAVFSSFIWLESLVNLGLQSDDPDHKKYYEILKTTNGRVKTDHKNYEKAESNSFIGSLIKLGGEVVSEPEVGNFFFRETGAGGHCGIVVKVDKVNKKYYTIEGNIVINDQKHEGVGAREYDFGEKVNGYEQHFLSVRHIGESIMAESVRYEVSGQVYTYSPVYTPYFEMTCWGNPNNDIELPAFSNVPSYSPPTITELPNIPEVPEKEICPPNKILYGYSLVPDGSASGPNEEEIKAELKRLNEEYREKYNLALDFQYDEDYMMYYACGDQYVPPKEPPESTCPPGYARDSDGVCKPNLPKAVPCDFEIPIPNNPKDMLPISTLYRGQHEVGKLNEDVLIDIITESRVGNLVPAARKKASHGMGLGVLNPAIDNGQSTGFGMFASDRNTGIGDNGTYRSRGLGLRDVGDPRENIYMIGYGWNANFMMAVINGVAGAIKLSDWGLAQASSHTDWAYALSKGYYSNGRDKTPNNLAFIKHLCHNETAGAFNLVQIMARTTDDGDAYNLFRGKKEGTEYMVQKNNNNYFYAPSFFVPHYKDNEITLQTATSKRIWDAAGKGNYGFRRGEAAVELSGGTLKKKEGILCDDWEQFLKFLDDNQDEDDSANRITLVVLDRMGFKEAPSLTYKVKSAVNLLGGIVSCIPGAGTALGGAIKTALEFLPAFNNVLNLIDTVEGVQAGRAGWNNIMSQMIVCGSSMIDAAGKGSGKVKEAVQWWTQWSKQYVEDSIKNTIGNACSLLFGVDAGSSIEFIGEKLITLMTAINVPEDKLNHLFNPTLDKLLKTKTGLSVSTLQNEYKMLMQSLQADQKQLDAIRQNLLNSSTKDLDEATKYWQNAKNIALGYAIGDFFRKEDKNIWQRLLNQSAFGGAFLNVPIIKESFKTAAYGGLLSSIPGIDKIINASLNVDSTGTKGQEVVLNKYGSRELYAMVKTLNGIPTSATEITNTIMGIFELEAEADIFGGKKQVILPSFMDGELRECIFSKFTKQNGEDSIIMCEPGMTYNNLTRKCEYNSYNGFDNPVDCYDVCNHLKQTPSELPENFGICEGITYFDTKKCSNATETANNIVNDIITTTITAGAEAFMADRVIHPENSKNICDCFQTDTTELEKQIICEASLHMGKKGNCNNEAFLKEMDAYIKTTHKISDGKTFDCSSSWCALFVAYNLLKSYEKTNLDLSIIKKTLTGYEWAVRYLVRDLLKNAVGEQSLIPRVGAISFSKSYVSNSNDHIGIVVCIEKESRKFYTIEGNVLNNENVPSVKFVEYDFSEIASQKIDEQNTDFSKSASANFGKQIRFIHLNEQNGKYTGECKCNIDFPPDNVPPDNVPPDAPPSVDDKPPDCIIKRECVENNKYYRYAFYTDDGWYVYSGEKGFWKYGAKKWLKLKNAATCEFVEVECVGKCGCEGGGCDCQTLQDKLDKQKADIQIDIENKYQSIINKLHSIPAPNLDLIIELINEVKKGLVVVLNDGDDNAIINNKTTEILLLLGELRDLLKEMKYCDDSELSDEIQKLVAEVTEELHKRRGNDIKKKYSELEEFLNDGYAIDNPDVEYNNDIGAWNDKPEVMQLEDVAVVEQDWYDATLEKLYKAIELAYQSLNECTCEDINMPTGRNVYNNYYGKEGEATDVELTPTSIENITNKLISKLPEINLKCEGADCPDVELTPASIENITNKLISKLPEINLKCEGGDCPDIDEKFSDLKNYLTQIKLENNLPDLDAKIDNLYEKLKEVVASSVRNEFSKDVPIPKTPEESAVEHEHLTRKRNLKCNKKLHNNSNNPCPSCGLDYSRCRCPKYVDEQINRKIVFDYVKDGERVPFQIGADVSNNYNNSNNINRGVDGRL